MRKLEGVVKLWIEESGYGFIAHATAKSYYVGALGADNDQTAGLDCRSLPGDGRVNRLPARSVLERRRCAGRKGQQ
jgi:hypothetical protein